MTDTFECTGASQIDIERMLDLISDALIVCSPQAEIQSISNAGMRLLGVTAKEVLGKPISDVLPGLRWERAPGQTKALVTWRVEGMTLNTADGDAVEVEVSVASFLDRSGKLQGLVCLIDDVSQRMRSERELRRALDRLDMAVESADLALWSMDSGTRMLDLSTHWKELLGIAAERTGNGAGAGHAGAETNSGESSIHLRLALARVRPDDRYRLVRHTLAVCRRRADHFRMDFRVLWPQGEIKWLSIRGRFARWRPDSAEPLMVGTLADVTRRRTEEHKLRETSERLRALSVHMESIREEENARVAREVHDEMGGALTAIKLGLSAVRSRFRLDPVVARRVADLCDLADATTQRVRKVSTALHPHMLNTLGLAPALLWYAKEFSKFSGIKVNVVLPEVLALDSHASLAVYHLVQEALTNVARHARATEVHLLASQDEFNLYVTVQDNGVGISETALAGSGGFGIQGMRERCAQFDGEMTIENEPGMGAIAGRAMDVVLLDLSLPDGRGLALLEHIKRHASGLPIIVYTMFSEAEYARTAFAAGASGYINKDNPAEDLVLAVRRVARGGRYVSAAMADILLGGAEEQKPGCRTSSFHSARWKCCWRFPRESP